MRHNQWSQTQVDIANRIAGLPREQQADELLKWALARITYYGPSDEPCAVVIREYFGGRIDTRYQGPINR